MDASKISSRAQAIRTGRKHGRDDAAQVANNPTYDRPSDNYDFTGGFTDTTSHELRVPDRWRGVFEAEYSRTISREVERLERAEGV